MRAALRSGLWAAAWLAAALPCRAGQWMITASAQPARVTQHDGSAEIIAEIRDQAGRPAPDGTPIIFTSTLGSIITNAAAQGGLARSRLTSSTPGTAEVSVVAGADSARVLVEFSDEAGSKVVESRAVRISGGYVAYSLEQQLIIAADNARLDHGSIFVEAGSIQYNVGTGRVRAQHNVRVGNGRKVLEGERLSYEVAGKSGVLMVTRPQVKRVSFDGSALREAEVGWSGGDALAAVVSDPGKSWVVARQITVFPGEKIQFMRAQFFLQGQRLVALPYHQIPLNSFQSRQGLVNQVISFNSGSGISVDVPFFYSTSARRSGSLHLRRNSYSGFYSKGWSLGIQEEYDLGQMRGALSLDNITSATRGLRWEHHQTLGPATADLSFSRYRYDARYPAMSYGSAYLRRGLGRAELTVATSGSSYGSGTDWTTSTTVRLPSSPLGRSRWHYDVGADVRVGTGLGMAWPGSYSGSGVRASTGIDLGLTSPMWRLGSKATMSTNLTGRAGLGAGTSTRNLEARFTLRRSLGVSSSATVNYTHILGSQDYWSLGRQRLDGNLFIERGGRLSLNGFFSQDLSTSGVFASLGGRYDLPFERRPDGTARWRAQADLGYSKYGSFKVTDSRLALSRDIGDYSVSVVFSPSGATGYGPYGSGFGFSQGKHIWVELNMGRGGY